MPNYRRDRTPGGTWYFEVCLRDRQSDLLVARIDLLRACAVETMRTMPFAARCWVVLPDRMHCIWTLPPGDSDFPNRWKSLKGRFSRALADRPEWLVQARRPREKGIWQNRFWEHRIRDATDMRVHLRHCHESPVRHGLVARAGEWRHSSYFRDVALYGDCPPSHGAATYGRSCLTSRSAMPRGAR